MRGRLRATPQPGAVPEWPRWRGLHDVTLDRSRTDLREPGRGDVQGDVAPDHGAKDHCNVVQVPDQGGPVFDQSRSSKRLPLAGVEGSARSAPRSQRPEPRGSGAERTPPLVGGADGGIRLGQGSLALLNVEEAAALLGVARDTVYRAIRAGTLPLPVYVIGRRMRIPRRAVERLLEGEADGSGSSQIAG